MRAKIFFIKNNFENALEKNILQNSKNPSIAAENAEIAEETEFRKKIVVFLNRKKTQDIVLKKSKQRNIL